MDWNEIAEKCKKRAGIESDSELADLMGVTRSQISNWRRGKNDLGLATKIRMLDLLGYQSARDMVLMLFPDDLAKQIVKKNNEVTLKLNKKKKKTAENDDQAS